jgi:hypothetical protein
MGGGLHGQVKHGETMRKYPQSRLYRHSHYVTVLTVQAQVISRLLLLISTLTNQSGKFASE